VVENSLFLGSRIATENHCSLMLNSRCRYRDTKTSFAETSARHRSGSVGSLASTWAIDCIFFRASVSNLRGRLATGVGARVTLTYELSLHLGIPSGGGPLRRATASLHCSRSAAICRREGMLQTDGRCLPPKRVWHASVSFLLCVCRPTSEGSPAFFDLFLSWADLGRQHCGTSG
jgi:hypothetical protein